MQFIELPFKKVEEFDYPAIAKTIEADGADIIWVALGAPKQEYFMHYLKPHLSHGVMIAVGAAFKFFSGTAEKRAPRWMVKAHMEFIFRICQAPKKQLKRCGWIVATLPTLLFQEWRRKCRK
jgi:N-acetylglucosaminyldiphosphoundecaprenol N-acetyl-beta-D-mannosaminyltransferase